MAPLQEFNRMILILSDLAGLMMMKGIEDPTQTAGVVKLAAEQLGRCEPTLRQSMSAATWRSSMLANKVPQRFASACAKVLTVALPHNTSCSGSSSSRPSTTSDSNSTSSASSSTSDSRASAFAAIATDVTTLVLHNLCSLVTRAKEDLGKDGGVMGEEQDGQPSTEAAAFGQQLQASGILQLLCTQVFANLSKRLQDEAGCSTQLRPLHRPPQAAQASSNARGNAPAFDMLLAMQVTAALRTFSYVSNAWPAAVFAAEIQPSSTAHVLELCWLAFQHIDLQLASVGGAQHTGSASEHRVVLGLLSDQWDATSEAAGVVLFPIALARQGRARCSQHSAAQHTACVNASPGAVPCSVILLAVEVYGMLWGQLGQLPAAPSSAAADTASTSGATTIGGVTRIAGGDSGGGAGSSSSFSRSTSTAPTTLLPIRVLTDSPPASAAAGAWELACQEAPKVPTTHNLLLQHLGISKESALFFAASWVHSWTRSPGYSRRSSTSIAAAGTTTGGTGSTSTSTSSSDKRIPRVNAAGASVLLQHLMRRLMIASSLKSAATPQLHLLLSPLFFFWAASQPARLGNTSSGAPADCTYFVASGFEGVSAAAAERKRGDPQAAPEWMWQLVREEMLPLLMTVSASVLGSLGCKVIGSTTTTSSSVGADSSSSTAGTTSGSTTSTSSSKHSTATSIKPGLIASELFNTFELLQGIEMCRAVLLAQLFETAIRNWQQFGQPQRLLAQLWRQLLSLISRSNPSPDSPGGRKYGALLQAVMEQPIRFADSEPQLQMVSLCFSVLKMLTAVLEAHPDMRSADYVTYSCMHVAEVATTMCFSAAGVNAVQQALTLIVPWLVLAGRVMLFVAPRLPAVIVVDPSKPSADMMQAAVGLLHIGLPAVLMADGVAHAMSAAGYDPSGSLLQLLQAAYAERPDGKLQVQRSALQSLGHGLSSLALPTVCNNPSCGNLSGPLELLLVKGKTCRCSGCHLARYCSRGCQAQHWKQGHKPVCRAVAAAAAAEAADAAAASAAANTNEG